MHLRTFLLTICALVFLINAAPAAAQWKASPAFGATAEIGAASADQPLPALLVGPKRYTGTIVGALVGAALAAGLFTVAAERGDSLWDSPERYYLMGFTAGGALIGLAFDSGRAERQ